MRRVRHERWIRITFSHNKKTRRKLMNIKSTITVIAALTLGLHLAVFAAEDPHKNHSKPHAEDSRKDSGKEYPLDTCVVSGMKLGSMGQPYIHKTNDREVRFCCKGCLPKFEKDPAKYLKKLEAADAARAEAGTSLDPDPGHHH
jgi:YHS domain-containing protein